MRPTVGLLGSPDRHGLDRLAVLRDDGDPVIFAANHHSHLDTPVVLTSHPRALATQGLRGRRGRLLLPHRVTAAASALAMGAIPIERTKSPDAPPTRPRRSSPTAGPW